MLAVNPSVKKWALKPLTCSLSLASWASSFPWVAAPSRGGAEQDVGLHPSQQGFLCLERAAGPVRTARGSVPLPFSLAAEMHGNEEHHPGPAEGDAQLPGEGKTADPPHPRHRPLQTCRLWGHCGGPLQRPGLHPPCQRQHLHAGPLPTLLLLPELHSEL